jgi:hypothetical protein
VPELALGVRGGHLVAGERVHRDVLAGGDLVEGGEYRRRRADRVHQADAEQAFGPDLAGEQRAVDVPERVERGRDQIDVVREELGHFGVRGIRRQRDATLDVAQERHVRVAYPDQPRQQ